ncbi:MAG: hypothetical protein ISR50_03845 [Alphaproteobacteria bacterium]|nr:hypothetical protein [Alphaproteobacteria bacterium]
MKTYQAAPALLAAGSALIIALIIPLPAWAHAFGVRYDLPLPLWLYLTGAGAAVALSFAVMAVFLKDRGADPEDFHFDLLALPLVRWLGGPVVLNFVRLLSLSIFAILLMAGFIGHPDPFKNIAPTFVWVIWWVGMAFVSTFAGNLWDLINPWKIIFTWLVKRPSAPPRQRLYPAWLGRWPAVLVFLIFAWMELISEQAEQPRTLATLIIIYSVITWAGMWIYGRDTWLRHGEIFTVTFGFLARFSFSAGAGGKWHIRLPAVGLLCRQPLHFSGVCFVLLLLTSVTFDGILETPLWAGILTWIAESQVLRPALLYLQDAGADLIAVIKTVALIIFPVIFVAVFFLGSKAIAWAGGGTVGTRDVAGYFVLSLVPIAIAYHLSHYLSYLLIAGQNIIPMLSDPFGRGWDLFGTTGYAVDIGIVNAKMIWYVAVTAIVVGHILAVYIGHVMAFRVFESRALALRSQFPMLILMVGYTMISLWILSQPIIS